jgi:hypothetical protein
MVTCKRLEYDIHEFSVLNDRTVARHPPLRAIAKG